MLKWIVYVFLLPAIIPLNAFSTEDKWEPEIHVQVGNTGMLTALAFSRDRKFVLSGASDGCILLWDTASGKEIRNLSAGPGIISALAFSPDGKKALVGDKESIRYIDLESGQTERRFEGHKEEVRKVVFSTDGKYAVSGSFNEFLYVWDTVSGKNIRMLPGSVYSIKSIEMSPDGKYCLFSSGSLIVICELASGKLIKTMDVVSNSIQSASFSPDGTRIVTCADDSVIIWETQTGKEMKSFAGLKKPLLAKFSKDGRSVISVNLHSMVQIWDISTGNTLLIRKLAPIDAYSAELSLDGSRLVLGLEDHSIRLYSDYQYELFNSLHSRVKAIIKSVALSPDGKTVITGQENGRLNIWDMTSGRLSKTFITGGMYGVDSTVFLPDGKRVLSGTGDGRLILWSMDSGKPLWMKKWGIEYHSVSVSPDGKFGVTGESGGTMGLWDLSNGTRLRAFTNEGYSVSAAAYSPDGIHAICSSYTNLQLWNLLTGEKVAGFNGHQAKIRSVAYSPNGNYAASGADDGKIIIWDIVGRKQFKSFSDSKSVGSVVFSPNGLSLLSGSDSGSVTIRDIASGAISCYLSGHSGAVTSIAVSPDNKFVFSGSSDYTLKLWNISPYIKHLSGSTVTFLANESGSEWIAYDYDGSWDSSARGGDLVAMVAGMECWNIDQFAVRYNRPDSLLYYLPYPDKNLINHFYHLAAKRSKKLGVGIDSWGALSKIHVPEIKIDKYSQRVKYLYLELSLNDVEYNLKSFNVFINDVPLYDSHGLAASGNEFHTNLTIELASGNNKIEVSCMNEMGAESYRGLVYARYDRQVKGNLHYIGFGVSHYQDATLDLKYADKDALDLAAWFGSMTNSYHAVYTHVFTNEMVTVANIQAAKELLTNASVDDTFVLFIAGHGVHDRDKDATYYYVTHNADVGDLSNTSANFEWIENLLQGIAPRNKLFLMDTCESGEVEEEVESGYFAQAGSRGLKARAARKLSVVKKDASKIIPRPYLMDRDRYIYNDLARRSGAIVFSSSKGGEFSYETDAAQNGLFTREILNCLESPAADKNRDGTISVDELREFVGQAVPNDTAGLQHPTVDRDNIYQKFGFPAAK